jgi:predicted transcriptional regulator
MSDDYVEIKMHREEMMALSVAIASGALHGRMDTLTEMLRNNRGYSAANGIEREIDMLARAGQSIVAWRPR